MRWLESPAAALTLFGLLAFVWMWPVGLSPADTISDVGDPLHLAYIMAWNAHQLIRDPFHLFDANSFYPWPQSLAFADHLVPESVLVAPVQWLTGNAVLAYNVAVFLGLFLSAFFMRCLIFEATGNAGAALVSGIVYAFNGFTLVETNRVQVIHLQWWPVALLFLGRFVAQPTLRRAMGLAAALALQGLSGSYYLAFSALIAPFWISLAFAGRGTRPTPLAAKRLVVAAILAAIPVALLIRPYLARGLPTGRVSAGVDLLAYISPAAGSVLWRSLLPLDPLGREFKGIVGLVLIASGLVAVARSRPGWFRSLGAIAFATACIGVVLSMGDTLRIASSSYGPGPHRLLLDLLPLEGLRHTPRFNALAVLGGAILAGLGVTLWSNNSRAASLMALTLGVVLPLEHWRITGYGMKVPPSAALRSAYRDLPPGPVVDLPLYPMSRRRYWAAYPYFSTYHWNPVLIGRTSFYPPGHEFLAWLLLRFPDANSVSTLSRLGVRTAVVHPLVWDPEERQTRLDQLREFPGLVRMNRAAVPFATNVLDLGAENYLQLLKPPAPAPLCKPSEEVPATAFTVFPMGADTAEEGLPRLTDRDPSTRWSSGPDQSGWYGFQVQIRPSQQLSAVSIETPTDRFPRIWPSLEIRAPGGPWVSVPSPFSPEVAWETLAGQLAGSRTLRMMVRFERRDVRAFRLVFPIHAERPTPNFEVEELRAFKECS